MENASKALLIEGGVLITIIVVSVGLYLMQNMAESTSHFYATMEQNENTEFNNKFLKYDGRTDLNIQDILTIMNLVRDNNMGKELTENDDKYIKIEGTISFDGTNNFGQLKDIVKDSNYINTCSDMLKESNKYSTIVFKCNVIKNNEINFIKKIEIIQI